MMHVKEMKPNFRVIIPTPIGEVGMAYSENPFLLLNISLPLPNGKNAVEHLKGEGWVHEGSHPKALEISDLIKEYFRGKPISFCWDDICMEGLTDLQRAVLAATVNIPFGTLQSYKEIAIAIGRPRAYRFVGSTLAKNPFPLLIPCHRVIRSNASIGQFGGGVALKKKLIELEAMRGSTVEYGKI